MSGSHFHHSSSCWTLIIMALCFPALHGLQNPSFLHSQRMAPEIMDEQAFYKGFRKGSPSWNSNSWDYVCYTREERQYGFHETAGRLREVWLKNSRHTLLWVHTTLRCILYFRVNEKKLTRKENLQRTVFKKECKSLCVCVCSHTTL